MLRQSMLMGYIKQIRSHSAAPSELYFTVTGEDRRYTFDEVLALSEEAWFRKSVALSPECNRHIVEASIAECNQMQQRTGTHHQIIASACSIDHARQVRSIYQELRLPSRSQSPVISIPTSRGESCADSATTISTASCRYRCWAKDSIIQR